MEMYRQGDVLIRRTHGKVPANAKPRADGVLRYGEATGHVHRVTGKATVFEAAADRLLIEATGTAEVVHTKGLTPELTKDHNTIILDIGLYEIVGQREYDDGEERRILD